MAAPDETPEVGLGLPGDASALLDAVVAISSDLDLHSVLNRIVESACRITGARYGALGVLGSARRGLVDFITVGVTDEQRQAIGDLPHGRGILGLLIDHPEPVRLPKLSAHPESYGFPPDHPPMNSFLGVPVRIRGTVFGNLYLTEKLGADEFTEQDEKLLQVFATAAGFVIENARAYAQSERRRLWLEASAQITEALQPPGDTDRALLQIVIGARRLVRAPLVALIRPDEGGHDVAAVDGEHHERLPQLLERLGDEVAAAQERTRVTVLPPAEEGVVVLVPLRTQIADRGLLLIVLPRDRTSLEAEEVDLLGSLADQGSLALDRAEAVTDRQELMLVADRDRIARDLHDIVIQRLFAAGLQLQGTRRMAVNDEVRERLDAGVAELDATIRDIRSTIFELQHGGERSLRADVRALVKEYVPVLGFTPLVRTSGPIDTAVGHELAGQVVAVVREALSNIARHAHATAAAVDLQVDGTSLVLQVTDNGQGLPAERQESGLRNARRRAAEFGGQLRLDEEDSGGTTLHGSVPLEP